VDGGPQHRAHGSAKLDRASGHNASPVEERQLRSTRRRSGHICFHALLERGIHRLEVPLRFLDYVFRQSPNEQS
jgi:hypothetical protein